MNAISFRRSCCGLLAMIIIAMSPYTLADIFTDKLNKVTKGLADVGKTGCDLISDCSPHTATNPDKPYPPEPESPCNGQVIQPDSAGNYPFSVSTDGASRFAVEFSKNGSTWNDPINGGMGLAQTTGETVPVSADKLLLASKDWYWRTIASTSGEPVASGKACKFSIKPSTGTHTLAIPEIISPACGSQIPAGVVLFDAKPGNGKFEIFKAELQYKSASGWTDSGLLGEIDNTNAGSKYGVAIPFEQLDQQGTEWRWRVRLYNEKMPIFGNVTEAPWTPWCVFGLPAHPSTKPTTPQDSPPLGGVTQAQASTRQEAMERGSTERSAAAVSASGVTTLPSERQRCRITAPYLIPNPPVIETAGSDVRQGDTFRIVCGYHPATKELEWPGCDTETENRVENFRQRIGRATGNRYSGMLDINGVTVRVTASPPGGLDAFELEHLWYQKEAGMVSVVCKVDNMLQPYVGGSEPYLEAGGDLSAGSRIEGREPVRAVDLPPRGQGAIGQRQGSVLGRPIAEGTTDGMRLPAKQARSAGSDTVDPTLNPQPEVPSAKQRDGTGSAISTELPAVQGQHGGSGAVDPKLNPQPEVPSAKQHQETTGGSLDATNLPAVQGRNGGADAVNPTLNPQPEVPSAKQRQGVPATSTGAERQQVEKKVELAAPSPETALPDKVDLQRNSGQSQLTEPDKLLPPPGSLPLPHADASADYAGQQTTLSKDDSLTQIEGGMPLPAGTTNSGAMNPNVEPVGLPVACVVKGGGWTLDGSVTVTNTTRQRLEKGTPVKWTVYKKGTQLGWLANTETEGVYYDQGVLNAALAVGQAVKVGVFAPESLGSYECKASVMPSSTGRAVR